MKLQDLEDKLREANEKKNPKVEVKRGELDFLFKNYKVLVSILETALEIRKLEQLKIEYDNKLDTFEYLNGTEVENTDKQEERE